MHYRRALRLVTFVLAAAIAVLAASSPAFAAAPFKEGQSDGFYRTKLGNFEVTALLDGAALFDPQYLRADAKELQPLVARQFMDTDHIAGAVSGFLVNTGTKLILVDAGSGGLWGGPALGKLVRNLKKSGYRPEQVDIVLLTHLHADHVGGIITAKGARTFPNAVVQMTKADSEFWLSEEIAKQAPKDAQLFFSIARRAAKPYVAAKKWIPFTGTAEIVPGVKPYPIVGHTPGHTGYEFKSGGQTMLVWGDVVHAGPVQMERPDIGVIFDADGPAAIKARQQLFAELVQGQTLVAGAHMLFPSLGRLRKDGDGYAWVPVPYTDKP